MSRPARMLGALVLGALCACGSSTSGGDDDAPKADASPDDPDSGPDVSECEGLSLTVPGVFDVDLKSVHVTGHVTLDGASPTSASGAGWLTFRSEKLRGSTTVRIDGSASYAVTLPPGPYDIEYQPAEGCELSTSSHVWPCNAKLLRDEVALTADGVLDLDLRTVLVSGTVTLKGQPFPSTQFYASLYFSSGQLTSKSTSITPTGYKIRLFADTYTIGYRPPGSTACGTSLPCNSGVIKEGVTLTASGVLDLDVPKVVISGSVSLNGTLMSGSTRGGAIQFAAASTPTKGNVAAQAQVAITDAGTYRLALLPNSYTIAFSGVPNAAADSPLPRGAGILKAQAALTTDGVLDLDVPAVAVRGKVTVNGAAPTLTTSRGALTFVTTGASLSAPIAADATYSTVVVKGDYDLGYAPSGCPKEGDYPCNGASLRSIALNAAGVLDVDLKVVNVRGKMTFKGAALPTSATPGVSFASAAAAKPLAVSVAKDDTYTVRLWPGVYDVGYDASDCVDDLMPMPCNSGVLKLGMALNASGVLDIDVPGIVVKGHVTLEGAEVPSGSVWRGAITFVGKTLGTASSPSFGASGPISYETHLLPGRYVFLYRPSYECVQGSAGTVPCAGSVLAGCK